MSRRNLLLSKAFYDLGGFCVRQTLKSNLPSIKSKGVFLWRIYMKDLDRPVPESAINGNHPAHANGSADSDEAFKFKQCANNGRVYDKDTALEQARELPFLYQGLSIRRKESRVMASRLEEPLLNGSRIEQVVAAATIYDTYSSLKAVVTERRKKKTT